MQILRTPIFIEHLRWLLLKVKRRNFFSNTITSDFVLKDKSYQAPVKHYNSWRRTLIFKTLALSKIFLQSLILSTKPHYQWIIENTQITIREMNWLWGFNGFISQGCMIFFSKKEIYWTSFNLKDVKFISFILQAAPFKLHYVENVHIRSFSGPYFLAFALNTKRCGVIRTRKIPNTDTFTECWKIHFL